MSNRSSFIELHVIYSMQLVKSLTDFLNQRISVENHTKELCNDHKKYFLVPIPLQPEASKPLIFQTLTIGPNLKLKNIKGLRHQVATIYRDSKIDICLISIN